MQPAWNLRGRAGRLHRRYRAHAMTLWDIESQQAATGLLRRKAHQYITIFIGLIFRQRAVYLHEHIAVFECP